MAVRLNLRTAVVCAALLMLASDAFSQTLEEQLRAVAPAELAKLAKQQGDATRGAIVFFQQHMACAKCHAVDDAPTQLLGPNLAAIAKDTPDTALIESVLEPSKVIRKGYESVTTTLADGKTQTGIQVERTDAKLVLRDAARDGALVTIAAKDIDDIFANPLSLMPAGQVNQLASQQQFLDLVRYLLEIRDGGAARARELQPSPTLLTLELPEYEAKLDHAGLIRSWDAASLKRGEAIYQRVCANCHGTLDRPGSLPTSLRFGEGRFKNGSDPHAMYQTITRGFGQMAPQTWMVPSQKYDVIHYIRETYLRTHNTSQWTNVDDAYLKRLPTGDTRGPEPSKIVPWSAMDYGPALTHTYEIPGETHNFAYKGIAVRLDPGAGGVSRGSHWTVFDTDTLRMAAAWSADGKGENFIDWRGIQFNGEHGIHPRIVGRVAVANSTGPGWAEPRTTSFTDDQRVVGRDGRRYGPLPNSWGKFRGTYHHGQQIIFSYRIGDTDILESPGMLAGASASAPPRYLRTFHFGPRPHDLWLQVAEQPHDATLTPVKESEGVVRFGPQQASSSAGDNAKPLRFDGQTYVEVSDATAFDLTKDFTIAARVKTKAGGTIFAVTQPGPKWSPDGQSLFIRDGRLCFDIGWVGVITSRKKVADDQWHEVAATWTKSEQKLRLYIDNELDTEGKLAAKGTLPNRVARIGFTSPNFPSQSYFAGELDDVTFYSKALPIGALRDRADARQQPAAVASWSLGTAKKGEVEDSTGNKHHGVVRSGDRPASAAGSSLVGGFVPESAGAEWKSEQGRLRLRVPAGKEPLALLVWTQLDADRDTTLEAAAPTAVADLSKLTHGGAPRWPERLTSQLKRGADDGPFAVDTLTAPATNPWLAQLRFSGLDFFSDGSLAVCTWDGDVWRVRTASDETTLEWQRIATGLFQPLGLKVIKDKVHLTCRDQLAVLHDLNGDGETDFYQCLNNDHQVTEHFHEFAMGLQTDVQGNFYYAKSGRHALAAVVPHHGTLLRISPDGSHTDILATGFRAANGVCLNPDGSFVVTDQEGFWNPKNRINWVTLNPSDRPNFYGNMFGYTDVTDTSDSAMVPPLCWITNAFDRSPAELLWVDSPRWGSLNGALLNLSYGYGKVFVVPHEQVNGNMQGGMIELPIAAFPTGVMRGRFHPADQHLYLCGMFAWAGSATEPGGLYRLRATGQPLHLPIGLHARRSGLTLEFSDALDPKSIDVKKISVKTWSLKRTASYGSKHYDEQSLNVSETRLSEDGKSLHLVLPDIRPTWCMEVKYSLRAADGKAVAGTLHNTIHKLAD